MIRWIVSLAAGLVLALVISGCGSSEEDKLESALSSVEQMQRDNHDQHEIRTVPWGEQALVEDYDILGEKTGDAALITVEAPQVRKDSMDEKEYAKVFVTVIGKDGTYDAGQLAYAHAYALLSDGSKIDIHWDVMNDTALDGQVKPGEKVSGYIAFETDQIPEKVVVQGMYLDEVEWTGDSES